MDSPTAASGSTKLADWLELKALASHDGNSSFQDLVAELRRGGSTDAVHDSTAAAVDAGGVTSERLVDSVFTELEDPYLFAFPRRTRAAGFSAAVDQLAQQLGEGGGAKQVKPAIQQKDAHLDLVVWHGFADKRPGQVIAFGQCAAGANWATKLSELPDTRSWCQAWMLDPPCVPAVRMFFMPHRPTREEWATRAVIGGVLFDRCRIASHAPELLSRVRTRGIKWSKAVLASQVR